MATTSGVVNISYADLLDESKDLSAEIEKAYGPEGLGILTVSDVPEYLKLRSELLPLAHKFATLPEEVRDSYVDSASNYSVAWSHGKERFNGKPDTLKGSYYANPQYDVPTEDSKLIEQFPFYCRPNIWPKEEHVANYAAAFKRLGQLIVSVGQLVAHACDGYVKKVSPTYDGDKLRKTIAESKCAKGRLLYYFPTAKAEENVAYDEDNLDSWCGWHLDHGSLTGLTKAIFMDENGNETELKDKRAGLYIRNRAGDIVKATWKDDQLAFQIGESAQIHSGGKLVATPHCVRGTSETGVSRSTLAVFMQPQWDVAMSPPENVDIKDCAINVLREGMDFNHFTEKRLAEYYN